MNIGTWKQFVLPLENDIGKFLSTYTNVMEYEEGI